MRKSINLWLGVLTCSLMLLALYMVFVFAPTEAEQGDVQRIFYFHLPCAWIAFLAFGLVAIASALYLWMGQRIWDDLAYASAEIGTVFCTLVLVTGSVWARPTRGLCWTEDSRLTPPFLFGMLYGGYLLLRALADETEQVARFAAVIGIIGAVDVPVIIVSVRLWRTIHPAVLLTREGQHGLEDARMIAALLVSIAAFTFLFAWLLSLRLAILRMRSRAITMRQKIALAEMSPGTAA